jgi:hypothetical protein
MIEKYNKFLVHGSFLCLLSLMNAEQAFASSAVCKTPDGYTYEKSVFNNSGIGGTGDKHYHDEDDKGSGGKGIGGTGQKFTEKGIGGTGQPVVFFGQITGFASICVNGAEVHYNKDANVIVNGKVTDVGALKVGHVVSFAASQDNNGEFYTKEIAVQNPVVGRVSGIIPNKNKILIEGKTVHVNKNTNFVNSVRVGDKVSVSGLVNNKGDVLASLVSPASKEDGPSDQNIEKHELVKQDSGFVSIQGYPSFGKGQRIEINKIPVLLDSDFSIKGGKFEDLSEDQRVIVFGQLNNGELI